jgi:hypothetical protein
MPLQEPACLVLLDFLAEVPGRVAALAVLLDDFSSTRTAAPVLRAKSVTLGADSSAVERLKDFA